MSIGIKEVLVSLKNMIGSFIDHLVSKNYDHSVSKNVLLYYLFISFILWYVRYQNVTSIMHWWSSHFEFIPFLPWLLFTATVATKIFNIRMQCNCKVINNNNQCWIIVYSYVPLQWTFANPQEDFVFIITFLLAICMS